VSVPKEEEEIVDVGVKQKKRGRPRKIPGTDPVNKTAILEKGGPDPQGGNKER
jgi:hypothetical protein